MSKKRNKRNTKKFRKKVKLNNQKMRGGSTPSEKDVRKTMVWVMDTFNNQFECDNYKGLVEPDLSKSISITPLNDLDIELKREIQTLLDEVTILTGECHLTSWVTQLINPKIKSVLGWVSNQYKSREEFEELYTHSILEENDTWLKCKWVDPSMEDQFTWYHKETNRNLFTHSWNELNGVHFDIQGHCHNEHLSETLPDDMDVKNLPVYFNNSDYIPFNKIGLDDMIGKERMIGVSRKKNSFGKGLIEYCHNHIINRKLIEILDRIRENQELITTSLNRFIVTDNNKIGYGYNLPNNIKIV